MSMTHIQTVTVTTNNVVGLYFSSIPQNFTDLLLVLSGRNQQAVITGTLFCYIGTPAAAPLRSGYSLRTLEGNGSGSSSASQSNDTQWNMGNAINGNSATSNTFSSVSLYFPNYTSSQAKTVSVDAVLENNATTAGQSIIAGITTGSGATSPINYVAAEVLNSTFYAIGSTASLYGITRA